MKTTKILWAFFALVVFSCNKTDNTISPDENKAYKSKNLTAELPMSTVCGGSFSGSSSGSPGSLYTYSLQAIDVSCAANGATITVNASALDVPNRFEIFDQNNQFIAASGSGADSYWIGNSCLGPGGSCYGGPWGSSIDFPFSNGQSTFTFTKVAGKTYYLKVQTIYPPATFSPNTDAWSVNVSCSCAPPPSCPSCQTLVNGVCVPVTCPTCYTCVNNVCVPIACGGSFSGSSSGAPGAMFTYSLKPINISCAAVGKVITVSASALDVPNKFEIIDQNNQFVAASGSGSDSYWIGNPCLGPGGSCYGGPWGSSIDYPFSNGQSTFTFTKVAGKSYFLKVQTIYPPANFSPNTDAWSANVSCGY